MEEKKTTKYETIKKEIITVGDRKRIFFTIKPTTATKTSTEKKANIAPIMKSIKKGCSGCNRRKVNSG